MDERNVELIIDDISDRGEGIGRADGMVVFVPGALPGDRVRITDAEDRGRFLRTRGFEMLEPSEDRVAPACRHAGECGGCPLMGLSYEAQLRLKERHVRDALARIGGISDPPVRPALGAEAPFRYRNKAEFALAGNRFGYYRRGTHELLDIDDCLLLPQELISAATAAAGAMKPSQKFFARLIVRCSAQGEVMTIREGRDGSADSDMRVMHDEIVTDMGTLRTEVSPLSFYQINPAQTTKLYSKVQEYAAPSGSETVLDLYCGAGSIGLSMASHIGKLIGVESVKDAVIDANRNAVINGIVNDRFICGRAEEVLPSKLQGVKADIVILDPPRGGCDPRLIESVLSVRAPKLIYVSCNPATLARDVKLLSAGGYRLAEATPVDMFPQTLGIECAALLELR